MEELVIDLHPRPTKMLMTLILWQSPINFILKSIPARFGLVYWKARSEEMCWISVTTKLDN